MHINAKEARVAREKTALEQKIALVQNEKALLELKVAELQAQNGNGKPKHPESVELGAAETNFSSHGLDAENIVIAALLKYFEATDRRVAAFTDAHTRQKPPPSRRARGPRTGRTSPNLHERLRVANDGKDVPFLVSLV